MHIKEPTCCRHSGTLWDLVALYPKETNWNSSEPIYIDGPVAKIKAELQGQTSKLLQAPTEQAFSSKAVRDTRRSSASSPVRRSSKEQSMAKLFRLNQSHLPGKDA
jgi:hypothetical protein